MKPDRISGIPMGAVGVDPDGKHVLVTNLICTLPHANTEVYQASHGDGCLMAPYESLVFDMDGDTVTGWHMEVITGRALVAADDKKSADIRSQMQAMLDKIYPMRRLNR
jgi:hypothetical protein